MAMLRKRYGLSRREEDSVGDGKPENTGSDERSKGKGQRDFAFDL
jgi:hypothetical protein